MSTKWLGIFAVLSLLFVPGVAGAAPAGDAGPLRLTTDQDRTIRLDRDAVNVIVNNPDHADVTLSSPRLLIITPHLPGATSMTVLDAAGKTILEKDIIVSNVRDKYVRVRRVCAANDSSCAAASYSYCPDGCYEVTTVPVKAAGSAGSAAPSSAAVAQQGMLDGEPAETLIGPADSCPDGYAKTPVPGVPAGDESYTCAKQ